jgi:hypothetical protein
MKTYKDPSFQERGERAAEAKQRALDNLRSKPPVDETLTAERQAARLKREAAEAEKRASKKAAEQAARAAKQEAKSAAEAEAASKASARSTPPTEAERKLARDARYAARKSRT